MDTSKFLAKVMGIYLILISAVMLSNMSEFLLHVDSLINNPPLMFVAGFFTVMVGLLLVVGHSVWEANFRLLITLIGWLTLIKGLSLVLYPHFIDQVTILFMQDVKVAYAVAIVDLIIGLLLTYFGFKSASQY